MRSDTRGELLLYGIAFGCFFQQSVLLPVLPLYVGEFDVSVAAVGFVLSVRFLVPALFAAQVGAWTSRIGLRRSLIFAGLAMVGAAGLYLGSDTILTLIAAQVANGMLYLVAWVAAQTYATRTPNRDFVVGIFAMTTAVGMTVAPILGGVAVDIGGYDWAFGLYAVGALMLAANAVALGDAEIGRPMRVTRRIDSNSSGAMLLRPGLQAAFMFSFLCLFTISLRSNVLPLFLDEIGFSASLVGLVLGAGALGQAAVRPFTHVLMRRYSLTSTLVLAVALAIAGLAAMAFVPIAGVIITLAFLHGGGAGLHQSYGLVLVADNTSEHERGYAVGLRATISQAAVALAPIMAGVVATIAGLGSMLVIVSATLATAIPVFLHVLRRAEAARPSRGSGD